jgi:rhodanese-related sulfurtransferase
MRTINREKLKQMLEGKQPVEIIDVHSEPEFRSGHLPRAINVPLGGGFEQAIKSRVPDKKRPVVVYCCNMTCHDSETAAVRLEEIGYRNVFEYQGGKDDWCQGGEELTR